MSLTAYLLSSTQERREITMEDLLTAIANVGFPIAVAAYLLIRIESKMDNLSSSINQLSTILSVKLGGNDGNKVA
jgi:flagellar biogenesis protein FliO